MTSPKQILIKYPNPNLDGTERIEVEGMCTICEHDMGRLWEKVLIKPTNSNQIKPWGAYRFAEPVIDKNVQTFNQPVL